ncbi:MAG: sodium:calcium antiporter [Pirellulaceae bacterium]
MIVVPIFLAGCVLLYQGAEWLVRGAAAVADSLGIPKAVVGLTLVAFGTSAPELFVNLIAASQGHTDFALSNVSGSNLANLCVGFGICGLVTRVRIRRDFFAPDLLLQWIAVVLVVVLLLVPVLYHVPLWGVLPLAGLLVIYFISLTRRSQVLDSASGCRRTAALGFGLALLGGVCLYAGGEAVLYASLEIAHTMGISDALIGFTIVAVGTSIPDISASIIAVRKGEESIAVGNLLGSNISNVLVVLSGTLVVARRDLAANGSILMDYGVLCVLSLIFLIFGHRQQGVSKVLALFLLFCYLGYMAQRIYFELA